MNVNNEKKILNLWKEILGNEKHKNRIIGQWLHLWLKSYWLFRLSWMALTSVVNAACNVLILNTRCCFTFALPATSESVPHYWCYWCVCLFLQRDGQPLVVQAHGLGSLYLSGYNTALLAQEENIFIGSNWMKTLDVHE